MYHVGSNGLTLEPSSGRLVLCEHGERRVSRYVKHIRLSFPHAFPLLLLYLLSNPLQKPLLCI